MDGNEFVKSKNGENNIALKYEQKDGEDKKTLHAYVDGVEVPSASQGISSEATLYNGTPTSSVTINISGKKYLIFTFTNGNSYVEYSRSNHYWQALMNIDIAVSQGYFSVLNRGGGNADRDYDFVWNVTKSGNLLILSAKTEGTYEYRPVGLIKTIIAL